MTSLTTLQSAIGDLLRAYLNHTTSVLGGVSGSEVNAITALDAVTANILTNARPGATEEPSAPLPALTGADVKPIKKKKQRRRKDPNAPKAPPTAYFLYAQSARTGIKEDLGPDAKGNAVTEEASRRWNALSDEEKEVSAPEADCRSFSAQIMLTVCL